MGFAGRLGHRRRSWRGRCWRSSTALGFGGPRPTATGRRLMMTATVTLANGDGAMLFSTVSVSASLCCQCSVRLQRTRQGGGDYLFSIFSTKDPMDVKYHKYSIYMNRIKCVEKEMEMGLMALMFVEKV
ncbi:hypothetical protein BHE74_00003407 [Ensete ventricosum]|nr:hypothetical protein BHE74_00003407 [Ensete ventricosum]